MLEIMDSDGSDDEEILVLPVVSNGPSQASTVVPNGSRLRRGLPSSPHKRTGSESLPSPTKLVGSGIDDLRSRRQSSLPPSSPGYDADKLSFSKTHKQPQLSKNEQMDARKGRGKSYGGLPQAAMFSDRSDDMGFRQTPSELRGFDSDIAEVYNQPLIEEYMGQAENVLDSRTAQTQSVSERHTRVMPFPHDNTALNTLQSTDFVMPTDLVFKFDESEIHTGLTNSDDTSIASVARAKSPLPIIKHDELFDELAHDPIPPRKGRISDSQLLPTQTMSDLDSKLSQASLVTPPEPFMVAPRQETPPVAAKKTKKDKAKKDKKRKRKDEPEEVAQESVVVEEPAKKGKRSKRLKTDPKSEERATEDLETEAVDNVVVHISPLANHEASTSPVLDTREAAAVADDAAGPETNIEEATESKRVPLAETPPNSSPQKSTKVPHSPLNSSKVPFRVGLSKRRSVPSLLTIRK